MKKAFCTLLILMSILTATAQLPGCDGNRYRYNVFEAFDSTLNIQYGQNYTMNQVLQNLKMDIFEPKNDTATKRPLAVFIHGGGFMWGTRQETFSLCMLFALKGYVTATCDYRLIDVPLVDSLTVTEGMVQAVSDAKAAVRSFVEDAATNNKYRIDTNYIFISGVSAGGVTASHVAYLNASDNIPAYLSALISENGGFTGNSSANTHHTVPIKGVINYSGALWHKEFISTGEPPLFSVHDSGDLTVPCFHGLTDAFPFPLYVDGSCAMQQEANLKSVYNDIFINNSSGHCTYFYYSPLVDTVMQKSADFLYNLICNYNPTVSVPKNIENEILIYPNPAREWIDIRLPAQLNYEVQIHIFNSSGILVKEIENNLFTQVNISGFPPGLYFVHLKNHPGPSQKFVKL